MAQTIPSEFRSFVRDTGIRAFDRLAARVADLDVSQKALVKSWSRLSARQKEALFDQIIDAAQLGDEPSTDTPQASRRVSVKRYDPEEVKKTLPKAKVKAKAKTKPKAKAKTKNKAGAKPKTRAAAPSSES